MFAGKIQLREKTDNTAKGETFAGRIPRVEVRTHPARVEAWSLDKQCILSSGPAYTGLQPLHPATFTILKIY